jgi:hypothetical protein
MRQFVNASMGDLLYLSLACDPVADSDKFATIAKHYNEPVERIVAFQQAILSEFYEIGIDEKEALKIYLASEKSQIDREHEEHMQLVGVVFASALANVFIFASPPGGNAEGWAYRIMGHLCSLVGYSYDPSMQAGSGLFGKQRFSTGTPQKLTALCTAVGSYCVGGIFSRKNVEPQVRQMRQSIGMFMPDQIMGMSQKQFWSYLLPEDNQEALLASSWTSEKGTVNRRPFILRHAVRLLLWLTNRFPQEARKVSRDFFGKEYVVWIALHVVPLGLYALFQKLWNNIAVIDDPHDVWNREVRRGVRWGTWAMSLQLELKLRKVLSKSAQSLLSPHKLAGFVDLFAFGNAMRFAAWKSSWSEDNLCDGLSMSMPDNQKMRFWKPISSEQSRRGVPVFSQVLSKDSLDDIQTLGVYGNDQELDNEKRIMQLHDALSALEQARSTGDIYRPSEWRKLSASDKQGKSFVSEIAFDYAKRSIARSATKHMTGYVGHKGITAFRRPLANVLRVLPHIVTSGETREVLEMASLGGKVVLAFKEMMIPLMYALMDMHKEGVVPTDEIMNKLLEFISDPDFFDMCVEQAHESADLALFSSLFDPLIKRWIQRGLTRMGARDFAGMLDSEEIAAYKELFGDDFDQLSSGYRDFRAKEQREADDVKARARNYKDQSTDMLVEKLEKKETAMNAGDEQVWNDDDKNIARELAHRRKTHIDIGVAVSGVPGLRAVLSPDYQSYMGAPDQPLQGNFTLGHGLSAAALAGFMYELVQVKKKNPSYSVLMCAGMAIQRVFPLQSWKEEGKLGRMIATVLSGYVLSGAVINASHNYVGQVQPDDANNKSSVLPLIAGFGVATWEWMNIKNDHPGKTFKQRLREMVKRANPIQSPEEDGFKLRSVLCFNALYYGAKPFFTSVDQWARGNQFAQNAGAFSTHAGRSLGLPLKHLSASTLYAWDRCSEIGLPLMLWALQHYALTEEGDATTIIAKLQEDDSNGVTDAPQDEEWVGQPA